MTAPEREALVKDLRGESARIAEYAAPNGWAGRAAPLLNKAADLIEALSRAPAVTVTEGMVTAAAQKIVATVRDRNPQRSVVYQMDIAEAVKFSEAVIAELVLEAALKSTTPQTGSQE